MDHCERDPRVRAAFKQVGGRGLSAEQKTVQLVALRGELHRLLAEYELTFGQREAYGHDVEHVPGAAEMFLRTDADLIVIGEGREAR